MTRSFFEQFFNRTWNLRKQQKEFGRIAKDVIRLRNLYPEVYAGVLKRLGLNVEEWREFKAFMDEDRQDDDSTSGST